MANLINIDGSAHDRMIQKYAKYFRNQTRDESQEGGYEPRLCIEGWAVIFEEPILNKNEILVFERGCFDEHIANGCRTEFWLAHDSTEVVGSNESGLELCVTGDGLAFRMPLSNRRYADTIMRMVESKKQAAISVGITRSKERTEMIGNREVIFIEHVELRECSLVAAGSCEQAFARLIDANQNPSLCESVNSITFKIESGIHNARVQGNNNSTRLRALKHRISALEAKQQTPPVNLSMTTSESTRIVTERYDTMRAERRANLLGV
jgi:HK97 family phage prohead protease